jgi:hypothetical protein
LSWETGSKLKEYTYLKKNTLQNLIFIYRFKTFVKAKNLEKFDKSLWKVLND